MVLATYLFRIIQWWNIASLRAFLMFAPTKSLSPFFTKHPFPNPIRHKYVLTLTTSPKRLSQGLAPIFENIRMSHVHRIILSLPKHFRNDPTEVYHAQDIADLQAKVPKLQVHWIEQDTGPELKFLGCLDAVAEDEVILVMDDDTLYKNTLIEDYETALCSLEDAYIRKQWALKDHPVVLTPSAEMIYGIYIQPGYCSFAVPKACIDVERFKMTVYKYKKVHPRCARHDDFTIGATIQELGFQRIQTKTGIPLQLEVGFSDDALHMQSLSFIKHAQCSEAIWTSREQCPLRKYTTKETLLMQLTSLLA